VLFIRRTVLHDLSILAIHMTAQSNNREWSKRRHAKTATDCPEPKRRHEQCVERVQVPIPTVPNTKSNPNRKLNPNSSPNPNSNPNPLHYPFRNVGIAAVGIAATSPTNQHPNFYVTLTLTLALTLILTLRTRCITHLEMSE